MWLKSRTDRSKSSTIPMKANLDKRSCASIRSVSLTASIYFLEADSVCEFFVDKAHVAVVGRDLSEMQGRQLTMAPLDDPDAGRWVAGQTHVSTEVEIDGPEIGEAFDALLRVLHANPGRPPTNMVEISDLQALLEAPEDRRTFQRMVFPHSRTTHP